MSKPNPPSPSNYQSWTGVEDPKFGYGAMLQGYLDNAVPGVTLHKFASTQVHMGVPRGCPGFYKGQHKALFTMWETDTLPLAFIRYMPLFDQILVPCEHNRILFSQHHPNVTVVPLGVDSTIWRPDPKAVVNNTRFQFRAGGSLWRRKGLDAVVEAFRRLNLPDADLRIKAAPHALDAPQRVDVPNVYLDREWMTLEEQADWFRQADCYIAASRGEGFGLMPLQAIAAGIPTIITATSGQAQFAHLASSVCRTRLVPADTLGKWDEPDVGHLLELMRHHYQNRHTLQVEAYNRAPQAAEEFSWRKATDALTAAVPPGRLLKNPKFQPFAQEIPVVALRPVNASIAGRRIVLKTGEETILDEGLYQVLHDSNAVRMV